MGKILTAGLLILLISCRQVNKRPIPKNNELDQYPAVKEMLNNPINLEYGVFYSLLSSSDTAVRLQWGTDSKSWVYNTVLPLPFAERLRVMWANKEFLIMQYGTGSGTWINLVLPLTEKYTAREVNNAADFDNATSILVTYYNSDTILIAENLKSGRKQAIVEENLSCRAIYPSLCLDTVYLKGSELYWRWKTPESDSNKSIQPLHQLKLVL